MGDFENAIALIDAANKEDPNQEIAEKALVFRARVTLGDRQQIIEVPIKVCLAAPAQGVPGFTDGRAQVLVLDASAGGWRRCARGGDQQAEYQCQASQRTR